MRSWIRLIGLLTALLGSAGCAGTSILRVTSYWGEAINLCGTGCTYAWAPPIEGEPPPTHNASFNAVVHQAIEQRMGVKGYALTAAAAADLWLSFRAGLQVPQPRPGIEHVEEAALAIDIVEPQTRRVIWVGTAHVRVDHSTPPDARRERIHAGIRRILYQFPNSRHVPD